MAWKDLREQLAEEFAGLAKAVDKADLSPKRSGALLARRGLWLPVREVFSKPAEDRPYQDPTQRKKQKLKRQSDRRRGTGYYAERRRRRLERDPVGVRARAAEANKKWRAKNPEKAKAIVAKAARKYEKKILAAMTKEQRSAYFAKKRAKRDKAKAAECSRRWYANLTPEQKKLKNQRRQVKDKPRKEPRKCSHPGCQGAHKAKGFCDTHYQQQLRQANPEKHAQWEERNKLRRRKAQTESTPTMDTK